MPNFFFFLYNGAKVYLFILLMLQNISTMTTFSISFRFYFFSFFLSLFLYLSQATLRHFLFFPVRLTSAVMVTQM